MGALLDADIAEAAGLAAPLWDKLARRRAVFTHGLFAFSCMAASIGLEFRSHYFIFLIPASAILVGTAVSSLSRLAARERSVAALPALALAFGCVFSLYAQSDRYSSSRPRG